MKQPQYVKHRKTGVLYRLVVCEDGEIRQNRKACKQLGFVLTKREKRLAKRAARRVA